MAIQSRRGLEIDLDLNKFASGETGGTTDTKKIFYAFAPGDAKRMSTYEDMKADIEQAQEEITDALTEDINLVIAEANTSIDTINQTNTAIQTTEATRQQQELDRQTNTATAIQNADDAADRANQAADDVNSILLGSIATDTTLGVVKGGGNVEIAADGQMDVDLSGKLDKTGDSKDNTVTFTEALADTDIVSEETHATLFGKILKRFATIATSLSEKFNKSDVIQTDTVNNTTQVPSSAVTYALGQEIDTINAQRVKVAALSASVACIVGQTQYTFNLSAYSNIKAVAFKLGFPVSTWSISSLSLHQSSTVGGTCAIVSSVEQSYIIHCIVYYTG